MKKNILLISLILTAFTQSNLKFKANIFFDAYYNKNFADDVDNESGMWIRRIYLTADNKFSDKFSARVRLELTGADFNDGSSKLSPVLKDMYLKWKMSDKSEMLFGVQSNPSVGNFENFYGMRHIEKTPSDLYKIESTRDTGIGFKTKLSDKITYHALFGNGDGNSSENDKGKIFSNSFVFNNKKHFVFLAGHFSNNVIDVNEYSFHIAKGVKNESFQSVISFDFLEMEHRPTGSKAHIRVASLSTKFFQQDDYIFFRADRNFTGIAKSPSYYNIRVAEPFNLLMGGYQFQVDKKVSISPNLALISYDTDGFDTDYIARVTFHMKW